MSAYTCWLLHHGSPAWPAGRGLSLPRLPVYLRVLPNHLAFHLPSSSPCIQAGAQGSWLWTWKDRIDRAFMAKFGADLDFEAMAQQGSGGSMQAARSHALEPGLSADDLALLAAARMRCGGCGSKVGATTLSRVLRRLQEEEEAEAGGRGGDSSSDAAAEQRQGGSRVLVGLAASDDAAVLEPPPPGHVLVQTVDFFRTMVTDPFLFGQIAANHALSDCHAMGEQAHS